MKRTANKNLFLSLFAAAGAVLAVAPSPAAAWDLAVAVSGNNASSYGEHELVIDGKGRAVVAWRGFSGMDETLQQYLEVAIRPAGATTFGPPTTISNTSANVYGFDIAASKKGTVTAVWDRGTDYDNRWLEVSDLGKKDVAFGTVSVFTSVSGTMSPQLALDKKGNATALWLQHSTGIVATAYRKAGDPFGPVDELSDSNNYNAVLAVGPKGNAVAAWSSNPGPNTVEAAMRPAGGDFAPAVTISTPGEDVDLIQIDMNDKGNSSICSRNLDMTDISADGTVSDWFSIPFDRQSGAIIKWDKKGNQYAFYTSFFQKALLAVRPAGSTTFGTPIQVSDPALGGFAKDMIVDKKGNVRVIWTEYETYGRVMTAYKPVGGVFDIPVQLSTDGVSSGYGRIVADRKGNVTAIWQETDASYHTTIMSSYQPR